MRVEDLTSYENDKSKVTVFMETDTDGSYHFLKHIEEKGSDNEQLIKSSEKLGHIPVIALTSFTEEESREKALSAGFDGYAIKTNKENILRAVEHFLIED